MYICTYAAMFPWVYVEWAQPYTCWPSFDNPERFYGEGCVLPTSSYRLGVKSSPLHKLYAPQFSTAIREALARFDKRLPGFASNSEGLLHGVETRTSAPVGASNSLTGILRLTSQIFKLLL